MIDEVQKAVIGPMDVVEDQHQWVAGGEALQEATPGLEQLLAAHVARLACAHQGAKLRRHAVVAE